MHSRRIEDAFSMSAFLAFLELREFLSVHPSLEYPDAITSIKKVRSVSSGLDFSGGLALLQHLDSSVDWQLTRNHLRLFASEWVSTTQPHWTRLVPYGRERLRGALSNDEMQCFREAGLFDEVPDEGTLEWWDDLAGRVRGVSEADRMKRARHAERLSMQFELDRLRRIGVPNSPRWVALEDNSLGYDILSYDLDVAGNIVNRLIEVKSTLSDEIFLTRNEWENASSATLHSAIHVWEFPIERLREYSFQDVALHVPIDRGEGTWQNVRIALSD